MNPTLQIAVGACQNEIDRTVHQFQPFAIELALIELIERVSGRLRQFSSRAGPGAKWNMSAPSRQYRYFKMIAICKLDIERASFHYFCTPDE